MPITTCTKCGAAYEALGDAADDPSGLCTPCWRRQCNDGMRRARGEQPESYPDYGGVLGADGQVHSDADPGL